MARITFTKAVRRPGTRGKWHLIGYGSDTVCGAWCIVGDWDHVDRTTLDPNDLCANCLRETP